MEMDKQSCINGWIKTCGIYDVVKNATGRKPHKALLF